MIYGKPVIAPEAPPAKPPSPEEEALRSKLAIADETMTGKLSGMETNVFSDPEPNWTQARNDHSEPLPEGGPVPEDVLYYDREMKAYVYDPKKRPQTITIDILAEPEMSDAFMFKIYKQLPKYLPIPYDVPIGVDISVHRSGGDSVYQVGESSSDWVKWITGQFEGSVWASKEQITAIGCEIRHKTRSRFIIKIIMA